MKKNILATMAMGLLFMACDESAGPEEERGQDERLFGHSPIHSAGNGEWSRKDVDAVRGVSFRDSATQMPGISFVVVNSRGTDEYISLDWYTAGGKIYINNIWLPGSSVASNSGVTFNYNISGDTLSLSGGPTTGEIAQFAGIYVYYDFDKFCAENPNSLRCVP